MDKLGVLYHPQVPAALTLAQEVGRVAQSHGATFWLSSPWDDDVVEREMADTDLIICIGGDGSVLRAARGAIPRPVPILGVNMGRLGFLSELKPEEAIERLPDLFEGHYRIEHRAMLTVEIPPQTGNGGESIHALNDAVVGRASIGRPVTISLTAGGVRLATVHADAVIVSTATGSTAYNLSAGGPVLHPESSDLAVTAVAPHLTRLPPLILAGDHELTLIPEADQETVLSIDGQLNRRLWSGTGLSIRRSPHRAYLIRFGPQTRYYERLSHYLGISSLE